MHGLLRRHVLSHRFVAGRQNEFASLASLKLVVSMLNSLKDDVADLKQHLSRAVPSHAKPPPMGGSLEAQDQGHGDGAGAAADKGPVADARGAPPRAPGLAPSSAGQALEADSTQAHTRSAQGEASSPHAAMHSSLDLAFEVF